MRLRSRLQQPGDRVDVGRKRHHGVVEAGQAAFAGRRIDRAAGIGDDDGDEAQVGAEAGEILTSRTVRDLVVGSDVALQDRGSQPLKGIEGSWQLFAVMER
jgi:hypothetical protein